MGSAGRGRRAVPGPARSRGCARNDPEKLCLRPVSVLGVSPPVPGQSLSRDPPARPWGWVAALLVNCLFSASIC